MWVTRSQDGAGSSGAKAGGSGDEVHLVVFVHGFKVSWRPAQRWQHGT